MNPAPKGGDVAYVSLYQLSPDYGIKLFDMGDGVNYGGRVVPDAPETQSGILQPGYYQLRAEANSSASFSTEIYSSSAAVNFKFELGLPPPKKSIWHGAKMFQWIFPHTGSLDSRLF